MTLDECLLDYQTGRYLSTNREFYCILILIFSWLCLPITSGMFTSIYLGFSTGILFLWWARLFKDYHWRQRISDYVDAHVPLDLRCKAYLLHEDSLIADYPPGNVGKVIWLATVRFVEQLNMKIDIKIITYYMPDDLKFRGDYTKKEIYSGDKLLKSYGDAYHDNGNEKSDGFLDCLECLDYTVNLTRENRVDEDL